MTLHLEILSKDVLRSQVFSQVLNTIKSQLADDPTPQNLDAFMPSVSKTACDASKQIWSRAEQRQARLLAYALLHATLIDDESRQRDSVVNPVFKAMLDLYNKDYEGESACQIRTRKDIQQVSNLFKRVHAEIAAADEYQRLNDHWKHTSFYQRNHLAIKVSSAIIIAVTIAWFNPISVLVGHLSAPVLFGGLAGCVLLLVGYLVARRISQTRRMQNLQLRQHGHDFKDHIVDIKQAVSNADAAMRRFYVNQFCGVPQAPAVPRIVERKKTVMQVYSKLVVLRGDLRTKRDQVQQALEYGIPTFPTYEVTPAEAASPRSPLPPAGRRSELGTFVAGGVGACEPVAAASLTADGPSPVAPASARAAPRLARARQTATAIFKKRWYGESLQSCVDRFRLEHFGTPDKPSIFDHVKFSNGRTRWYPQRVEDGKQVQNVTRTTVILTGLNALAAAILLVDDNPNSFVKKSARLVSESPAPTEMPVVGAGAAAVWDDAVLAARGSNSENLLRIPSTPAQQPDPASALASQSVSPPEAEPSPQRRATWEQASVTYIVPTGFITFHKDAFEDCWIDFRRGNSMFSDITYYYDSRKAIKQAGKKQVIVTLSGSRAYEAAQQLVAQNKRSFDPESVKLVNEAPNLLERVGVFFWVIIMTGRK